MHEEDLPEQIILAWRITPQFPPEVKAALKATGKYVYFPNRKSIIVATHLTEEEVLAVIRAFYPRAELTYSMWHKEHINITLRPKTFLESLFGVS